MDYVLRYIAFLVFGSTVCCIRWSWRVTGVSSVEETDGSSV
jgi:hypothetical protein